MDAIYDDYGDSDDEMPPLMDSDDEDDEDIPLFTPRLSLGEIFEQLGEETKPPGICSRQSFGWTDEDVGGHGLCIEDIFAQSTDSQKSEAPNKPTAKANVELASVEWSGLQAMHPNKIFCIVIEYIIGRWPHLAVQRRVRLTKGQSWRYTLAQLAKDPLRVLKLPLNARERSDPYYSMTAWISRLSGRGIRPVRRDMNDEWVKNRKWKSLDDSVKCRFHFLRLLEKESLFQDAFPEVFGKRPNGRSSQASFQDVGSKATEPLPVTQCYGWLATYNTDLGLQDPDILQWVQQGLRGSDLADKLKEHDLIKKAFSRFVSFHKDRADKHGFKTWAVGLEHSMNAKHPARVHLHTYAGVDIRGGHILMGVPVARPVSKSSLTFPGCDAPIVRFTIIRRPSPSTILNGVSTGMYYVAGAKESSLMLEASAIPIEDQKKGVRVSTF